MTKEIKELSFEKALARLEEILKILDQRELDLENAIRLFEEGLLLIQICEQRLKEAKTRVEVILRGREGFILESLDKAKEILKNGR
ncbi:MAG: exodeoxyribonuclease VII small subunit [Caldimicrobium sp.]|nr:exodeoxyribonuclease VII small subunit [Caldimicrobium sp.]MCX7873320.1 exodeoxyribonuclease VII small subunit [Caldimicrobium sp.]MDW8093442.1 exodeoxyribonuclease VII small subunit [Caldimicrobium sp.]